ncbi:MAG: pirin family protein [Elusimicrobia bacterium]|nr:pirin family protein [Elusimicrobiota bacterium]
MENIKRALKNRKLKTVLEGNWVVEGAGVKLKRLFGFGDTELTDPFLLLDNFGSENPEDYTAGFPWHPHRGIETITYMIEGVVEHGDSLGNSGVIRTGQVQWMTAGSGIIHQEMPQAYEGTMRGFQLWANLPRKDKMTSPRYRDLKAEDMPEYSGRGYKIKLICGDYGGVSGPAQDIIIKPWFFDVQAKPGANFSLKVRPEDNVLCCVFEGSGFLDKEKTRAIVPGQLALLEEGDRVSCTAGENGLRFLLIAGKPLKEPVAWRGPIVMNTEAELKRAFEEYRKGTFIKTPRY